LVDPSHEGRLVHLTGKAETESTLADGELGVSSPGALRLRRTVVMYQWQESQESDTKKKLGGGTETVTTYSYEKGWHSSAINSGSFKKPEGHANPGTMPYKSAAFTADDVRLGAFALTSSLVNRIGGFHPLPLGADAGIPEALGESASLAGGGYYIGAEPASPAVGDVKIAFEAVDATLVSLVSRQISSTFKPYMTEAGGTIELLQTGTFSAESMFQAAEKQNAMLTWILRLVGFLLMAFGLAAVLRPLSVLGDVVPFIGSLIGAGTGLVAFLLALVFSLLTIGIAWFFYRPLLGILLITAAVGCMVGLMFLTGKKMPPKAAAEPSG
jgi:hypothetical protein